MDKRLYEDWIYLMGGLWIMKVRIRVKRPPSYVHEILISPDLDLSCPFTTMLCNIESNQIKINARIQKYKIN